MNKDMMLGDRKTRNIKGTIRFVTNICIILILVHFSFSVNIASAQINYWTPNIIPHNGFYPFRNLSPSLNWLSSSLNYGTLNWPNSYSFFNGYPLQSNRVTPLNIYPLSPLCNLFGPLINNAWLSNYNKFTIEDKQVVDREVYAVYSAILNGGICIQKSYKLFIYDHTKRTTFLPAVTVNTDYHYDRVKSKISTTLSYINEACNCLEEETVYDFYHDKNAQEYPLGYYFNFNAPYELVSLEKTFLLDAGATSFSNVGFNSERTQALVEVKEQPRGRDVRVVLNKKNGFWVVRYVKGYGYSD